LKYYYIDRTCCFSASTSINEKKKIFLQFSTNTIYFFPIPVGTKDMFGGSC
jgi:hypothetical protein